MANIIKLLFFQVQPRGALMPHGLQGEDVFLVNMGRFWKRRHRLVDAVFAQQMQRGERRPVGVVAHVVGFGAFELKSRVKAGDLETGRQFFYTFVNPIFVK